MARRLAVTVVDVLPELTVAEQDERHGKDLFARDPGLCCAMRKVEPLNRALAGYDLWFTGVRRDEAPTRTNTPLWAGTRPTAWSRSTPSPRGASTTLVGYATDHDVPVNLLLPERLPSIGCRPCTRPVAPGEDPRAGRWAGTAKTEWRHPRLSAAPETDKETR
ncbi:phosphoadenosine phosphosulfate reductase domain-containing protein [Micrococcus luteus]|uniref:phosphoadenosine phosphosulfate reductase domain-containing protein n=1 Tax=Micrococcus luteus TaxID=1270 RepID=UPI00162A2C80|nr:phosphoadenosine phosphosulfate reductase family protein [Micrococcus luteus]